MKYKLFEEYNDNQQDDSHPGFLQSEEEIHAWLKKYDRDYYTNTYTINDGWSVDVDVEDDRVFIEYWELSYIRVKFNKVENDFICAANELITLEGAPNYVGDSFGCSDNNLTSLKYAPNYVDRIFVCSDNNLITLEGAPDYVGGDFWCVNNNLVTLGHKSDIKGDFRHDELQGTLEERIERYLNYLDTLDESDKKSSLHWLYDVDEEFNKSVVEYAVNNNINLSGVNMDIASDALKYKDSGLF